MSALKDGGDVHGFGVRAKQLNREREWE